MKVETQTDGIIYIVAAYVFWGFLPIYWRLIGHVSPDEILAHRVVWSFVLMLLIVFFTKNSKAFIHECFRIMKDKKNLLGITVASFVISLNWLTYIWAVNNGFIIEASLGYYINPIISILLGVIILGERLSRGQFIAFVIASIGVMNLTIHIGVFPWISLILAFSFATYGLLKKTIKIEPMFGLTIETMIVTPIAFIYLLALPNGAFSTSTILSSTSLLLIGTGVATAMPLLLFANGTKRIPLAMLGFLQYIAPTIMLIIGIVLFKETFSTAHLFSFALIWVALIFYLISTHFETKKVNRKIKLNER